MVDMDDLFERVSQLSFAQRQQLRDRMDKLDNDDGIIHAKGTPEERLKALREGFAKFREGLSEEELDEMVAAMNEEYIE